MEGGFQAPSLGSATHIDDNAQALVTDEQVAQVRHQVEPQHLPQADDAIIRRFIRATGGNLPLSAKRLNATLSWRASHKPELVVCSACAKNPRSHYMHVIGHCTKGRPIIYSCVALAENKVYQDNKDHLIQTFEATVKCMPAGVEQWIWICDFHGFGLSDALNVRIAKTFLDISAAHYPERLGSFLLVDAPSVFSIMWKALESLIDPKTFKKIKFLPYDPSDSQSKLKSELSRIADAETLPWLLREMAENRDKQRASQKVYNVHAIHKAASSGGLLLAGADADGKLSHSASEHDLRGTTQLLGKYSEQPDLLEPQATATTAKQR